MTRQPEISFISSENLDILQKTNGTLIEAIDQMVETALRPEIKAGNKGAKNLMIYRNGRGIIIDLLVNYDANNKKYNCRAKSFTIASGQVASGFMIDTAVSTVASKGFSKFVSTILSRATINTVVGAAAGSAVPVAGTIIGAAIGLGTSILFTFWDPITPKIGDALSSIWDKTSDALNWVRNETKGIGAHGQFIPKASKAPATKIHLLEPKFKMYGKYFDCNDPLAMCIFKMQQGANAIIALCNTAKTATGMQDLYITLLKAYLQNLKPLLTKMHCPCQACGPAQEYENACSQMERINSLIGKPSLNEQDIAQIKNAAEQIEKFLCTLVNNKESYERLRKVYLQEQYRAVKIPEVHNLISSTTSKEYIQPIAITEISPSSTTYSSAHLMANYGVLSTNSASSSLIQESNTEIVSQVQQSNLPS